MPDEEKWQPQGLETLFVQFLVFRLDGAWRRLSEEERAQGREEFAEAIQSSDLTTYSYSLTGLKASADLLLWRLAPSIDRLQETASTLLKTGLGRYLELVHVLTGLVRPSTYVRKPTPQEQGMLTPDRKRYLIVYPFVKTTEWYLLSREARQGMMNEHIRVGHGFPAVRQLLAYSFGLDDQEFIVAYETDDLKAFQDLVMALRETEARRYTLRDTPIFTGVYRPLEEALALLG
jgi:chlorite dismutase